jgi:hypothetical protein
MFDYDVFISYNHHDGAWVRDWLLPRLERASLRVCIDYRDFDIGVSILVNMERAVERSRKTLLVLTPNWIKSEWTNFEASLVQIGDPIGLRRRILPLMLEQCELPRRIALLTYADLTSRDKWESELRRIIDSFGKREKDTRQLTKSDGGLGFLIPAFLVLGIVFVIVVLLFPNARSHKTLYQAAIPLSTAISQSNSGIVTRPLKEFFAEIPSDFEVSGIKFHLASDSPVIETESQYSSNPAIVYIPVQKDNVVKIHLLMNMSYGAPKWTERKGIAGESIAKVWIVSGKQSVDRELEAGTDIREWVVGGEGVVNTVADYVRPVWTGHHVSSESDAVIDCLILQLSDDWQGKRLDYIGIEDRSMEILGSENPGILVFGITVEYLR